MPAALGETMPLLPDNALEGVLARTSREPAWQDPFCRLFLRAKIYFIPEPSRKGTRTLRSMACAGKDCALLFSSLPRLAKFAAGAPCQSLRGKDLLQVYPNHEFILNPGTRHSKLLSRQAVYRMLYGSAWDWNQVCVFPQRDGSVLVLGQPRIKPHQLEERLRRHFQTLKAVQKAYLAQIHNSQSTDPPRLLIGIQAIADWDELDTLALLAESDGSLEYGGRKVDMFKLGPDNLSCRLTGNFKPFYRRPAGLAALLKSLVGK